MNQQADIQLLRDYLNGTLAPDDIALLEKRVCLEDDLAELLLEISCDEAIIREWRCSKQSEGSSIFGPSDSEDDWYSFFRSKKGLTQTIVTLSVVTFWIGVAFVGQRLFVNLTQSPHTITVNNQTDGIPQTITEGSVELLLPTGVKVLITAPATFQVTGENEISLSQGMLLANVTTEAGIGFTVNTPSGSIVDLGTIFGMEVDELGASDVQVFKGKVELASSSGKKTILLAGNAMRCEAENKNWQPSEKLSKEFYAAIRKPNQTFLSEMIFTGDVGVGMFGRDRYVGTSYVMYSATPLNERFANPEQETSLWVSVAEHFVVVHFDEISQTWQFQCNEQQFNLKFKPVSTDLLIARVEAERNENKSKNVNITYLEKKHGTIHGISHGYKTSDITVRPDWFSGEENSGDFTLNGTFFIRKLE